MARESLRSSFGQRTSRRLIYEPGVSSPTARTLRSHEVTRIDRDLRGFVFDVLRCE